MNTNAVDSEGLVTNQPRVAARTALQHFARVATIVAAVSGGVACGSVTPPASQFPSGQAAIDRMHKTFSCMRGVSGEAKIDHFSDKGRVRGNLNLIASEPASMWFLVDSFGVRVSELTSDGQKFALYDMREKRFFRGPATACNIARLTQVPIPGSALVSLLRGEAPILVHEPSAPTIRWSKRGYYEVEIASKHEAVEILHLVPTPNDWNLPWEQQRLRVLDVKVTQQGIVLYHADLKDHRFSKTSPPRPGDEELGEAPIPPSGPTCEVEVPHRLHVEVPGTDDDVLFRYDKIVLNPPLVDGVFAQATPGGVQVLDVNETCK